MLINTYMDRELSLAKYSLRNNNSSSLKLDKATNTYYLKPPILPATSTYFYDNNTKLSKSSRVLAEDIILNNINIKTDEDISLSNINKSLKDNQLELYYTLIDYFTYGYGSCEVIKDGDNFRLSQIPASTLHIIKKENNNNPYYIAEQNINGHKIYLKIINQDYPENLTHFNEKKLSTCLWIGGDNFYEFYSKPYWLPAREHIMTKIALDKLNSNKISMGNINSGIIHINDQENLQSMNEDHENHDKAELIKEELEDAGSGLAVLYTTSAEPMKMEYINITDNNYEYLSRLSYEADQEVLSSYSIPRERLMINNEKESLNSNKTSTIWRIYLKYLNVQQLPFERLLSTLIKHLYGINVVVDIEVPLFSDDKKEETESLIKLFNNGLLTLKETIQSLNLTMGDLKLNDYDENNPLYNQRFYNGHPLNDYELSMDEDEELGKIREEINKFIKE